MRGSGWWLAILVLGCGPAVILEGDTEGDGTSTRTTTDGPPPSTQGSSPSTTGGTTPPNPVTTLMTTEPMTSAEVGPITVASDVDTGDDCFDPPFGGDYQPCEGNFCPGGGECLSDDFQTYEVCTRGCFDVCDCWPWFGGGPAPLACRDDLGEFSGRCVLDCSESLACIDGMFCVPEVFVCAFAVSDPPGGTSTSTSGGSSSTGVGDSGGGFITE